MLLDENNLVDDNDDIDDIEVGADDYGSKDVSTPEKDNAFAVMSKKLKESKDQIKVLQAEASKAKAFEEQYLALNEEITAFKAEAKKSEITQELKQFAHQFNIPESVLGEELTKYKDADIINNVGKLEQFLVAGSYPVFGDYIKGIPPKLEQPHNVPRVNTGTTQPLPIDKRAEAMHAAEAYVTSSKQVSNIDKIFRK